jgi:hypothetical protein
MSMAQTPDQRVQFADFGTYAVKSGGAVAPAYPVMLSTTNTGRLQDVTNVTADTDDPVGIGWLDIEDDDLEPGAEAEVLHLFSVVVWVRVGTGGATRGKRGVFSGSADGLKDAPAHGTTTRIYSPGMFLETGSVGEIVPMGVMPAVLSRA